jgi:hypothetical protein
VEYKIIWMINRMSKINLTGHPYGRTAAYVDILYTYAFQITYKYTILQYHLSATKKVRMQFSPTTTQVE